MTFTEVLLYLLYALDMVLRLVAIYVVPMNRRPQTAMAWLLLIFFFPIGGFILFLIFGVSHLPVDRVAKQDEISRIIAGQYPQEDLGNLGQPEWFDQAAKMNRTLGSMPLVGGNDAKFYPNYNESIDAMTEVINSAKTTVHCEFYILYLDATTQKFFDALVDARDRGVDVKVLVDHIASWRYPNWAKTVKFLNKTGLNWKRMLPINPFKGWWRRPDLRNHRKLLVIDGEIAFTGSQNIIDSQYVKKTNLRRGLHWKDLMVSFTGPIVAGINAMFVSDWYAETGEILPDLRDNALVNERRPEGKGDILAQVVPSGPAFKDQNNLKLFNTMMYAAKEKIVITSPYFIPDDSMFYAITSAVARGVTVELFVSEMGDQFLAYYAQSSYYEALLAAGVKIWLYETPTILHAKHVTVDDEVAVFGSSNLDMRSFALNLEISMMVWGESFLKEMGAIEQSYRDKSKPLDLDEWRKRSFWKKLCENICRPTASLQ